MRKNIKSILSLVVAFSFLPGMLSSVFLSKNVKAEITYTTREEARQSIIDEAKSLNVPDAFIRHNFAEDYEAGKLESPVTEVVGDEEVKISEKVVTAVSQKQGLEVKKVDTGVLARTKFDLGEFDFGDFKAGRVIYNMLAKKNLKGKAYLYFGESEEAFANLNIKRCASSDEWEETKNYTADVRDASLKGKGHIYLRFIADSALDEEGNILANSNVNGNLYFESMFFTEGSTPVLNFDLDKEVNTIENINGSPKHTIMGYGNMGIEIPDGYKSPYTDKGLSDETYELDYIRGRGNSTWQTPKKPYKVKLENSTDLFGMGKSKHWILLANYYDYSLIRNRMTYTMADKLGLEFSPKSICVDVVISGEYYGSYQLSQQVRVGKNNVNIDDLESEQADTEPGITGGYLLAMGGSWLTEEDDKCEYVDTDDGDFKIESPEYDEEYSEEAKKAQLDYINKYFAQLGALVKALDPDAEKSEENLPEGKNWRDYMDEQSFIDYYFIQEISENGDAYASGSTYLYKKRNDKLFWGPVWDFDYVAWDATNTEERDEDSFGGFGMIDRVPWLPTLLSYDEDFRTAVKKRWEAVSKVMKEAVADGGIIDKFAEETYYSALANYQVRGSILMDEGIYDYDEENINEILDEVIKDNDGDLPENVDVDEEDIDDSESDYVLNYHNEIERLKAYVAGRTKWIDANIDNIDNYVEEKIDYEPVKFYVDDKEYTSVSCDNEDGIIEEIPDIPEKEGYIAKGWFFTDENGEEHKLKSGDSVYYFDYGEDYEEFTVKPYDIYAKYVAINDYKEVQEMSFVRDKIYVPLESSEYYDGEEDYEYETLELNKLLNVKPFDADTDLLEWSATADEDVDFDLSSDGVLEISRPGEINVNVKAGEVKASLKVIALSSDEIVENKNFTAEEKINVNIGEYGDVNLKFEEEENQSYKSFNTILFKSFDEDIAVVNNNGCVYGKSAGETKIMIAQVTSDGINLSYSTITVKGKGEQSATETPAASAAATPKPSTTPAADAVAKTAQPTVAPNIAKAPGKAVIKKINKRKKTSKLLKLKLKKVDTAKGYQIAVYKTKGNAKKSAKALVKKYTKKTYVKIKSKKLKNNAKLFVRVRAYTMNGNKKIYGKWSGIKKS